VNRDLQAPPRLRATPLWLRVDQNRSRLAVFVVLFVVGSALLLDAALIAVPGTLLSVVFADDPRAWFAGLAVVLASGFGVLLAAGALMTAVQLSNAEHWVRSRFSGQELPSELATPFLSAVHDMSLAAGLSKPPRVIVIEAPKDSVNALALGTTRSDPLIGVTQGLLDRLDVEEQRAVAATLIARVVAGDIMFGTALAALMGPLKAVRESRSSGGSAVGAVADAGCADPGCADAGCSDGCVDGLGDSDGCAGAVGVMLFLALVALITYAAVLASAWIVTLWGRALQRTNYEKADAEGMLLLKDPAPMLSALEKAVASSNLVGDGDVSYDGIFYAATSGTARVEKVERRRSQRLREVLGVDGMSATH